MLPLLHLNLRAVRAGTNTVESSVYLLAPHSRSACLMSAEPFNNIPNYIERPFDVNIQADPFTLGDLSERKKKGKFKFWNKITWSMCHNKEKADVQSCGVFVSRVERQQIFFFFFKYKLASIQSACSKRFGNSYYFICVRACNLKNWCKRGI